MKLEELGWREPFVSAFKELAVEGALPGRVVWRSVDRYRVQGESGEVAAVATGKVWSSDPPVVGDWVVYQPLDEGTSALILEVLPRTSAFSRNSAGKAVERQVLSANIDFVFIVCGLDGDFNLRRIERYVTLAYNSGASPVMLLNKADLSPDVDCAVIQTESVSPGVPVHPVSALDSTGLDQLTPYLRRGKTAAFLGSSGAGKSTIINRLLGEDRIAVAELGEKSGKGRHTTTSRELFLLAGGGAVIDTPGMREIQVWGGKEGLSGTFPEIEELAVSCRFRDCRHESEVGCAVRDALESRQLDEHRLESYIKLRTEFENHQRRQGRHARMEERREGKRFAKMLGEVNRFNPKRKKP
jgi:ribosome biogenesis GTPase